MSKSQEMREQRCKLIADARNIMDASETLDAEQRSQVDAMLNDADTLKLDIDRIEALEKEERELKASAGKEVRELEVAPQQKVEERKATGRDSEAYRNAFESYLRKGKHGMTNAELRDLNEGTASAGGYLAPLVSADQASLQNIVIDTMDDAIEFMEHATVINVEGQITLPTQNALGSASWTNEASAISTSDNSFNQITLTPYKLATLTVASNELLADSVIDLQGYMGVTFGRRFAQALSTAFVNGTGSSQPTGITDGSATGVTAGSATAVTFDEMYDLFYSLKESYRRNGRWMMNTTVLSAVRQLKHSSGTNSYIWEASPIAGQPDTLFGRPVVVNDDCEAMTTGLKPILFGDLSYYWIAMRQDMNFRRLDELYANTDETGFQATMRVDGELTMSEAVKNITMA